MDLVQKTSQLCFSFDKISVFMPWDIYVPMDHKGARIGIISRKLIRNWMATDISTV